MMFFIVTISINAQESIYDIAPVDPFSTELQNKKYNEALDSCTNYYSVSNNVEIEGDNFVIECNTLGI